VRVEPSLFLKVFVRTNMARPLYRHTAHQERPQTVIRGTTESARTLPLPHQNPHFMRLSGIARHRDRAITVKPESDIDMRFERLSYIAKHGLYYLAERNALRSTGFWLPDEKGKSRLFA